MKDERQHHTTNDNNMLKDKRKYKEDYAKDDSGNHQEISNTEKELDSSLS